MKKMPTTFKAILCTYIIFCMIFFHERVSSEITSALKLWSGVLTPSLFPYLVLSQYITSSNVMDIFAPVRLIVQKIFNISSAGANVYLCSLVSGYPSGAACVNELYKEKVISKDEAERLVCFTNNAGPLFLISVVGANMLGSAADGLALYFIQTISASLAGIFLGKCVKKCHNDAHKIKPRGKAITLCTQDAISIMLAIGGYVVLSSLLGEIGIITIEAIPVYGKQISHIAKAVIYFLLEISNSMKVLSSFGNSRLTFALIAGASSWSGLCVLMQIKSLIPKEFLARKIVVAKIFQSATSFIFGISYKSFFSIEGEFDFDNAIIASLYASIVIFVVYLINIKRKKLSFR